MVTIEKVSGGIYHSRQVGYVTTGDPVEVSEELAGYLCERGDFERVGESESEEGEEEDVQQSLTDIDGVGEATAEALEEAGYTAENVSDASVEELVDVDGVGESLAAYLSDEG